MRYRLPGQTGLRVSELFLDATTFGGSYTPPGAGRRILDRYADAGGNVVDTASAYGESEDIIGELLAGRRRDGLLNERKNSTFGSQAEVEDNAVATPQTCRSDFTLASTIFWLGLV